MTPYYEDEHVTLYHGDCLEIDAWLAADVLVTDPPYGIQFSPRGYYNPRTGVTHTAIRDRVSGDATPELRDAALELWGEKPRIVFGSWRIPRPDPVQHRLVWHKKGQPPGPATAPFMLQDEEIYVTGAGFRATTPPLRSVIATHEIRQGGAGLAATTGHPTPKPVQLMEILVDRCPHGVIADPFAGSGSTLVAARNLGRKAIGVEIEERYCELIAKRLAQGCLDFGDAS